VGTLQPTTLVVYEAEIENIFDTTNEAALRDEGMDVLLSRLRPGARKNSIC
jgi:hypothetical protein